MLSARRPRSNPVHHLIGTAAGWGGNPDKDAAYASGSPAKNDGKTVYRMKVPAKVPVDAFWSISVYNAKGYFEKNSDNAYSVNSITGKKDADGGVSIQFGGCDGKVPNCLPITRGLELCGTHVPAKGRNSQREMEVSRGATSQSMTSGSRM